jgi:hypothetical protein
MHWSHCSKLSDLHTGIGVFNMGGCKSSLSTYSPPTASKPALKRAGAIRDGPSTTSAD